MEYETRKGEIKISHNNDSITIEKKPTNGFWYYIIDIKGTVQYNKVSIEIHPNLSSLIRTCRDTLLIFKMEEK